MKKKVQLEQLLFAQSWEDPALDRQAMPMRGARVATVGSGGCNTLTFLLDDPKSVLSFDYNPTQVWLLELKQGAFRALSWEEVLELFGVRASEQREQLLARALAGTSKEAQSYWNAQGWVVARGLLNGGRYERFVGLFQLVLRAIQGRRKLQALFTERTHAERAAFYEREWNTAPWRLLFKVFFNKRVLAKRGLSADYFHFSDGSSSFAKSFAERTERALVELEVRENPYLAQYVLGRYLDEDHLPEYLRRENFALIRARLDRLTVRQGDVRTLFDDLPAAFDAICLSNVFELMSPEETAEILPKVARALKPGGKMTLRNLMIPRAAGMEVERLLTENTGVAADLYKTDRSFVYRSFQVYTRSTEQTTQLHKEDGHAVA